MDFVFLDPPLFKEAVACWVVFPRVFLLVFCVIRITITGYCFVNTYYKLEHAGFLVITKVHVLFLSNGKSTTSCF